MCAVWVARSPLIPSARLARKRAQDFQGLSGIRIVGRPEGFRKAMQDAHLPIRDEYFCRRDFLLESGYSCGMELLKLAERPTAVFSCNSSMTLGLMRALSELRVRCPGQVSVVGFDDFLWSQAFSPKLTTVAQPSFELGRRAMEMLLGKIRVAQNNPEREVESDLVVLKAELRIRESTDVPRSSSQSPLHLIIG
jgi:DNA-binding LacI/PurR family transcriptional regulator